MRPTKKNPVKIRIGQIWADDDPRMPLRYVQVERIQEDFAHCVVVKGLSFGRKTKLNVKRLSTGVARFSLVDG
jgi:hypothetical protein